MCLEHVDPGVDDTTFCQDDCGQNLHQKCLEQWKRINPHRIACPMCRKVWSQKVDGVVDVGKNLDPKDVQLYLE
jgi:hypothetical protein